MKTTALFLMTLAMAAASAAHAQTFKTLYAFKGTTDGGAPWYPPMLYNGLLYGATYYGGAAPPQVGVIFQLDPTTNFESTYYTFLGQPNDGAYPMSGMVADPYGDFFGTTTQGGFSLRGTIYEITGGSEYVVYNFSGRDGEDPEGGLIIDPLGNIYGATTGGGANGSGTVFALTAFGTFVQLYSFGNYNGDGIAPTANLALYKNTLYGTTSEGGQRDWGTVFSLSPKTKQESILYSFNGSTNGGTPIGGLVSDGKGNLYGTASLGGNNNGNAGNGVIFRLNISSRTYTVVHTFTGPDGSQPSGALVTDGKGNLFGTTFAGGANGYGTVFQINSKGTFTTLHSFTNGTDGSYPYGGLTIDSTGNLYGTATRGGAYNWGTLFEITFP